MYPQNRIQSFSPASGKPSINRVMSRLDDFMKEFDSDQDKILARVCDVNQRFNDNSIYDIRDRMKKIVMDKVGIFRTKTELQEAFDELQELLVKSDGVFIRTGTKSANPGLIDTLRVKKMLKLALCIRRKCRISHMRADRKEVNR